MYLFFAHTVVADLPPSPTTSSPTRTSYSPFCWLPAPLRLADQILILARKEALRLVYPLKKKKKNLKKKKKKQKNEKTK
jgi:hypothetical protein